jgi:hypothetical protein
VSGSEGECDALDLGNGGQFREIEGDRMTEGLPKMASFGKKIRMRRDAVGMGNGGEFWGIGAAIMAPVASFSLF